ncbi:hypothetical protein F383_38140 [Gossypium arboreum]|uniref:Uncharacterized protein n=1 Tax=Gossypium arboreum TaxID=29729 RepID=A0A0B0MJK7_GOSAR|nr:hypothetical protein F383_38140 [Gossypium arboreum]
MCANKTMASMCDSNIYV